MEKGKCPFSFGKCARETTNNANSDEINDDNREYLPKWKLIDDPFFLDLDNVLLQFLHSHGNTSSIH
jgi:hypothetical protein